MRVVGAIQPVDGYVAFSVIVSFPAAGKAGFVHVRFPRAICFQPKARDPVHLRERFGYFRLRFRPGAPLQSFHDLALSAAFHGEKKWKSELSRDMPGSRL